MPSAVTPSEQFIPNSADIPSSPKPPTRNKSYRFFIFVFIPYFVLSIGLQWLSGIYNSELVHHPDEAAHITTSLMIHDYLSSSIGTSPMAYAERYYVHYPKIGFGMWPPVFHISAALWMLLFPSTQTSLMVMMALQCALLGSALALFAKRVFPPVTAFGLGVLLLLLPLIQYGTSMVMVDILLSLLSLVATMLLADYFRTERTARAVGFGVCASFAMLTKGNANAIVLMPLFLLLLTRKFHLLKKPGLYLAGLIIILIGGPWQLITMRFQQRTNPIAHVDIAYIGRMFSGYIQILFHHLGAALFTIAFAGLVVTCFRLMRHREPLSERDFHIAAAASLVIAYVGFHTVVPIPGPDERYMTAVLAPSVFFFGVGVHFLARIMPVSTIGMPARSALVAGAAFLLFATTTFAIPQRPRTGFAQAASILLPAKNEVFLVCSDSIGEGAFIVTVALKENRPQTVVLRASKMLSENAWFPTGYSPSFRNVGELETFLEKTPVDAVVVDQSRALWNQDRALLLEALRANPEKWQMLYEIPESAQSRHLLIYTRVGTPASAEKNIRVRMRITLGRDLEAQQ